MFENPAYQNATPALGTPTLGMTGGLPPPSAGPNNFSNPLADNLASMGRGPDTTLVHMAPQEVNSLRGLAQSFGGDLTTNPNTGLPEAGFLSNILPTLFGGLMSLIPGIGPLAAAGIVGLGTTAATGDLGKGLMAGLGAFGGASLGGALGAGGAGAGAAGTAADLGTTAAQEAAKQAATQGATQVATQGLSQAVPGALESAFDSTFAPQIAAQAAPKAALSSALGSTAEAAGANIAGQSPGFFSKFGDAAAIDGVSKSVTTPLAAYGLAVPFMQQKPPKGPEEEESSYNGPYKQAPRQVSYPAVRPDISRDSSEHQYFTPVNPIPGVVKVDDEERKNYQTIGLAEGGPVPSSSGLQAILSGLQSKRAASDAGQQQYLSSLASPQAPLASQFTAPPRSLAENTIQNLSNYLGGTKNARDALGLPTYWAGGAQNFLPGSRETPGSRIVMPEPPPLPWQARQAARQDAAAAQRDAAFQSHIDRVAQEDKFAQMGMPAPQAPLASEVTSSPAPNPFTAASPPGTAMTNLGQNMNAGNTMLATAVRSGDMDQAGRLQRVLEAQRGQMTDMRSPSRGLDGYSSYGPGLQTAMTNLGQNMNEGNQMMRGAIANGDMDQAGRLQRLLQAQRGQMYGMQSGLGSLANTAPGQPMQNPIKPPSAAGAPSTPGGKGGMTTMTTPKTPGGYAYAHGGEVRLAEGSFVVDARTVSELGNGSSSAGQELLARYGGIPLTGPGDGVSDSIKASIDGRHPARVARDEVYFPPEAVQRVGGAQKLYRLMDAAHRARAKAERGQDTGVRKGLA